MTRSIHHSHGEVLHDIVRQLPSRQEEKDRLHERIRELTHAEEQDVVEEAPAKAEHEKGEHEGRRGGRS